MVKGSSASKSSIDSNVRSLYKLQQSKVLEVAKPLLFLSNEKVENDSHHQAVKDALELLGDSFHKITHQRRHNILRQTSPSFVYLLNNPDNFDLDQSSQLFGVSFIRSMVKSADTQAKLGNLSREGQPNRNGGKSNSKESRFKGRRGDQNGKDSTGGRGQGSSNTDHGYDNGQHRGGFNGQQDRDDRNNHQGNATVSFNNPPSGSNTNRRGYVENVLIHTSCKIPRIGGRLKLFASAWNAVSKDPWVLNSVSDGFRLEFKSSPFQATTPSNMSMNAAQLNLCKKEVLDLISKGAVVEVPTKGFISGIL